MEERGGREGKDIQTLGKRISPDAAANKTTAAAARCSDRWREWRKGGENLSIPCMRKPILLLSPSTGEGRGGDPSSKGLLSLQGPFLSLSSPLFICLSSSFSPFWHGRLKEREKGKGYRVSGSSSPSHFFWEADFVSPSILAGGQNVLSRSV